MTTRRVANTQNARRRPCGHEHSGGVKLSDEMRASFCKGFALYFLRCRNPNLFTAYEKTLMHFFSLGYDNGGHSIMPPPNELPSFMQFKRFVTKIFGDPALVAASYQPRARCKLIADRFSAN